MNKKKIKNTFLDFLSSYIHISDNIYIETDLINFKSIFNRFDNIDEFCNFFYSIFRELVGNKGNIIFPTFSYSWGKSSDYKYYDSLKSNIKTGLFPNYLFKNKKVFRNNDPNFSFGIIGNSEKFFDKNLRYSFGKNSVFEKIIETKTKIVHFGPKKFDPTIVHFAENFFNDNFCELKYRFQKKFNGKTVINKKLIRSYFHAFVRKNNNLTFNESNLKHDLIKKNLLFSKNIFGGDIYICHSNDIFLQCLEGLMGDNNYLVKTID